MKFLRLVSNSINDRKKSLTFPSRLIRERNHIGKLLKKLNLISTSCDLSPSLPWFYFNLSRGSTTLSFVSTYVRDGNRWLPERLSSDIREVRVAPERSRRFQTGFIIGRQSSPGYRFSRLLWLSVRPPNAFRRIAVSEGPGRVPPCIFSDCQPIAAAAAQFLTLSRSSTGKLDGGVAARARARARNIKHDDRDNRDQILLVVASRKS